MELISNVAAKLNTLVERHCLDSDGKSHGWPSASTWALLLFSVVVTLSADIYLEIFVTDIFIRFAMPFGYLALLTTSIVMTLKAPRMLKVLFLLAPAVTALFVQNSFISMIVVFGYRVFFIIAIVWILKTQSMIKTIFLLVPTMTLVAFGFFSNFPCSRYDYIEYKLRRSEFMKDISDKNNRDRQEIQWAAWSAHDLNYRVFVFSKYGPPSNPDKANDTECKRFAKKIDEYFYIVTEANCGGPFG